MSWWFSRTCTFFAIRSVVHGRVHTGHAEVALQNRTGGTQSKIYFVEGVRLLHKESNSEFTYILCVACSESFTTLTAHLDMGAAIYRLLAFGCLWRWVGVGPCPRAVSLQAHDANRLDWKLDELSLEHRKAPNMCWECVAL
eukprot:3397870-Amphidinium_carterae.1